MAWWNWTSAPTKKLLERIILHERYGPAPRICAHPTLSNDTNVLDGAMQHELRARAVDAHSLESVFDRGQVEPVDARDVANRFGEEWRYQSRGKVGRTLLPLR